MKKIIKILKGLTDIRTWVARIFLATISFVIFVFLLTLLFIWIPTGEFNPLLFFQSGYTLRFLAFMWVLFLLLSLVTIKNQVQGDRTEKL